MLEENAVLQSRYRIVRKIGGGGMGQVYLAHDTRLADKPCAIKELAPALYAAPDEQAAAAEQFHREAAMLAHLNHPNLPNVYDYFTEGEHFYLVMDYVNGETLANQLERSPGGLPPETVVGWAVQLCDVFDYLHSQSPPVIFRDLKPSNVMVTADNTIKLIDFGVARLFDPSKGTDTLKMGTAGYAPPEQYAGQGQTTPRSDMYSLGVTIYELLTGDDPTAHPFVFTPPRSLVPAISPQLSNVVMKAVSLGPAERFQSAAEFKAALQKAITSRRLRLPVVQPRHGTGTTALPESAAVTDRPRSRTASTVVGILRWTGRLLLILIVVAVLLAVALAVVGSLIFASIVESAVATADWGLDSVTAGRYMFTEDALRDGVEDAVQMYAIDAVSRVWADLQPPDMLVVGLTLSDQPFSLQVRVEERNGLPWVQLERLNQMPLYVVGGILSGGINRGLERAWEESPVHIESFEMYQQQAFIILAR